MPATLHRLSSPQPRARDAGTFDERRELGPDDRWRDRVLLRRKGREAAISAGDDPLAPDDIGYITDALRHEAGMLDEIGRRIETARHHYLIIGDLRALEILPFVGMARVGPLKQKARRARPHRGGEDRGKRDVVGMRSL